jgi:hypothetical protein
VIPPQICVSGGIFPATPAVLRELLTPRGVLIVGFADQIVFNKTRQGQGASISLTQYSCRVSIRQDRPREGKAEWERKVLTLASLALTKRLTTTYHVNPLLCVRNYTLPRFTGRRTLSCLPLSHLVQNAPEETVR